MQQLIVEAVRQALKFFQSPGNREALAKGAQQVLKVATKIATKAVK